MLFHAIFIKWNEKTFHIIGGKAFLHPTGKSLKNCSYVRKVRFSRFNRAFDYIPKDDGKTEKCLQLEKAMRGERGKNAFSLSTL